MNRINYYGKEVTLKEAESIIKDIHLLLNKIISKYFK